MIDNIVKVGKYIVHGIAFLIALFLMITSFLFVINVNNRAVVYDNPLICLIAVGVYVLIAELIYRCISKKATLVNHILLAVVALYSLFIGYYWIMNAKSLPSGDPQSIFDIALRASQKDLLPMAPTGSYMSLWPFQSGIVFLYEFILRFIPNADYLTIQICNLPYVLMMILSGYFLVRRCFKSERAVTYWLLLVPLFTPYYIFINYMYGEIPSTGLLFFAAWMLTEYFSKKKIGYVILGAGGLGLAVMYRKNSLIFVVAYVLLSLLFALKERKKRYVLISAFLIVCTIMASVLPQLQYEKRAHNVMGKGVPAVSYLAMGMQDGGGAGPGWWNGYHSNLFMELDYNTELAKEQSIQSIKESMSSFMQQPGKAVTFYYGKLVSQWIDPDFSSLFSTASLFEDRTQLAHSIYGGDLKQDLLNQMNIIQSVIYMGLFIFCCVPARNWIMRIRKKEKLADGNVDSMISLLLLITIIGGFLFSMVWEGNSRYVMPYVVMMLPYSAQGYAKLMGSLSFKKLPIKIG